MKKYLTRIETSVGYETYILLIESETGITIIDGTYVINNGLITTINVIQTSDSIDQGPFKKDYYKELRFPITNTLVSEQSFEYGDKTTPEN